MNDREFMWAGPHGPSNTTKCICEATALLSAFVIV